LTSQVRKPLPPVGERFVRGLYTGLLIAVAFVLGPAMDRLHAQDGDDGSKDPGQAVYEESCVGCHQAGGRGVEGVFPSLRENDLVQGPPEALLIVVLEGRGAMPGFGENLSDSQIAAVLTYLRSQWGNDAGRIHSREIAHMREHIQTAEVDDPLGGR